MKQKLPIVKIVPLVDISDKFFNEYIIDCFGHCSRSSEIKNNYLIVRIERNEREYLLLSFHMDKVAKFYGFKEWEYVSQQDEYNEYQSEDVVIFRK